ncbi:MAG TPA: hypothetical protein VKT52_11620 [Ktedonobacterales bacterium]|nr:hypothetical protein [Ktedonobacterales bacterium]
MSPAQHAHSQRAAFARAALDDTSTLLKLHRLVNAVDIHGPSAARIISTRRSLRNRQRVGLFAGSFNPLTRAHVALADAARQIAALDAVVWTISAVTVNKERVQRASVPDRLAQLNAFAKTTPTDVVAVINRGLYVEEAEAMRSRLASEATLFLLVGFDKIVQIFDPRYYANRDSALRELFALALVLVAPRDDLGADALAELLARPENREFASFVQYIPVPPEHTRDSSSEARALAAGVRGTPLRLQQRNLRRLLPPEGLALARTGAYASPVSLDGSAASDRYTLRERWLHALDMAHVSARSPLPPLSRLVARAARPTATGVRLRAWLDNPATTPIPPEARSILTR